MPRPAPSPPRADLGPRLRSLVARAGLSLSEAARRAGSSQPYLSRVCLGEQVPRVDWVARLLGAIGARWADLD